MLRRVRSICLSVLLAAIGGPVMADTLELATKPFREAVLPSARISGSLVVGVQKQGEFVTDITLEAFVPEAWAGATLCARVVSVNGLYEAANEYRVAQDWTGGVAQLPYPTVHPDRLSQMERNEIAIRLSRGACNGIPEEATIAVWNQGHGASQNLLINSFQAEAVFLYVGDTAVPIRCEPITLGGKSAYDTKCPIEPLPSDGPLAVEILRIVNGQAAPPTTIGLWVGGR